MRWHRALAGKLSDTDGDLMLGVPLTIDVFTNHRELQIESKSVRASCMRFYAEQKGVSSMSDIKWAATNVTRKQ